MWCKRIWIFVKRHSTVPGAVVVFALAYILMLAVNAGGVGASWVQAVGSILAIGAGFAVVRYQDRARDRDRLREAWSYMEKALHSASYAVASVEHLHSQLVDVQRIDGVRMRHLVRLLQESADDMALIAFTQIEDQKVAAFWLGIKRGLAMSIGALRETLESGVSLESLRIGEWAADMNKQWCGMSEAIVAFADRHTLDV